MSTEPREDHNPHARIERRNERDELALSPLDKLERPPSLIALQSAIAAQMPRIDLPDVMLEVAARSGFADAFIHVSERHARVEDFTTSLCGGLVAQACNIGFEPLVRTDQPALSRARLSWVGQNFIRPETIAAANARIVAAQNALPIARVWGSGEAASADGIRFVAPSSAIHAGPNPKHFGAGLGITCYNLVSDQFTGLNAIVVPGTLRDSLVILGLLLGQETDLAPAEVMTDTAAYADTVFSLFWLLDYQFSPRLADIGDARFWRMDKSAHYGALNGRARNRVNTDLVTRNWEDMLRLARSLRLDRIHAGAIMRVLQVKDRPTTLARALAELGRIAKTLHIYVTWNVTRPAVLHRRREYVVIHCVARSLASSGRRAAGARMADHAGQPWPGPSHDRRLRARPVGIPGVQCGDGGRPAIRQTRAHRPLRPAPDRAAIPASRHQSRLSCLRLPPLVQRHHPATAHGRPPVL